MSEKRNLLVIQVVDDLTETAWGVIGTCIEWLVKDMQVQATSLLQQIPEETIQQRGTMPWYKPDYCLADFIDIVYKHTQEHCEQIKSFRESGRAS